MADLMPEFPVDDATLDLVWNALHPGPDAERSSIFDLCELYSQLAGSDVEAITEETDDTVELRDPQYHPHDIISALIVEVRRLRPTGPIPQPAQPTMNLLIDERTGKTGTALGHLPAPGVVERRCGPCGHQLSQHRRPLWFWRIAARWNYPWPFACRARVFNTARTREARCVCVGFRAA